MSICTHTDEALVSSLQNYGIRYLAPSDASPPNSELASAELIACLAQSTNPRLRLALIGLFVLNPALHIALDSLTAPPDAEAVIKKMYTAAACLQRIWSIRIGFYRPDQTPLPDRFSAELGLPTADQAHGKACLHALADLETFNQLSAYEGVMDHLFAQFLAEQNYELSRAR